MRIAPVLAASRLPFPLPVLFLLSVLFLPVASPADTTDGWKKIAKKKGVTVYARGADSRQLPELRAVATLDAKPIEIAAVIRDTAALPEWVHNCKEARVLKETDEARYTLNVTDAPWPVSDRYAILRGRMEKKPDGGIRIHFEATDELAHTIDPGPGGVWMARLVGFWDLSPLENGDTALVYQLDADPGGSLPKSLVRETTNDLPLNTVVGLRKRVKQTRGQYDEWIQGPGAIFASR